MGSQTWEDAFGRTLRVERERREISQQALADAMRAHGVTLHASAIAKMEARDGPNPRMIRLNEAKAAAAVLGLNLEDMTTGASIYLADARRSFERALISASGLESSTMRALTLLDQLPEYRELLQSRPELREAVDKLDTHLEAQHRLQAAFHPIFEALDG